MSYGMTRLDGTGWSVVVVARWWIDDHVKGSRIGRETGIPCRYQWKMLH